MRPPSCAYINLPTVVRETIVGGMRGEKRLAALFQLRDALGGANEKHNLEKS